MDTEHRVEALEQELEILKNQIQAALLDIQEHILTNTYPALRTGDDHRSDEAHAAEPVKEDDKPRPQNRVRQVEECALKKEALVVKKIAPEDTQPMLPVDEPEPVIQKPDQLDWSSLNRVEEWVTHQIQELGAPRTRKLIEFYGQKGRISPQVQSLLLGLVAAHDIPPTPKRAPNTAAPTPRAKPAAARSSGAPSAQKKAAPAQPGQQRKPAPKPAAPAKPEIEEGESSSLILRLIAGVHNAGAGITRRRNDG